MIDFYTAGLRVKTKANQNKQ